MSRDRSQRMSIADRLFADLQAGIIDGRYPAGTLLPSERELARLHSMNRQPVREALQRLRQQRLVEVVQGEGSRVRDWQSDAHLSVLVDAAVTPDGQPNPTLAVPLLRLRAVTMIEAARLAAMHRSEEEVAEMQAAISERRRIESSRPTLWTLVVGASKCLACRLIHNTMQRTAVRLPDDLRDFVARDIAGSPAARALVDAIAARDPEAAAVAAERLLAPAVERAEGRW